ncbi:MAG: AAA family ATPase [Candidatus Microsaccharimonas sp.]
MTRGIVIGKFYPPHKGHQYLINYALANVDSLTVLVCDSSDYIISAETRRKWLQAIHPEATVVIIPDIGQDDNSQAWAEYTIKFLGYTPDVVYSSENYGITYAECMKTKHVMVDRERTHIPISATRVRKDYIKEWPFLHDVVRTDLAIRVALVGAESTGKTTLSKALASHYNVPWVPEYGRLYSEAFNDTAHEWTDDEFVHIATIQQAFENKVATASKGLIICDTNAFATAVWQERYMGSTTPAVREIANEDRVDLYIIPGDEIPFVQDGTRDGEHIRHGMHKRFLELLDKQDVPYCVVTGSVEERLATATEAIDGLLKDGIFERKVLSHQL